MGHITMSTIEDGSKSKSMEVLTYAQ
nr:hypothetical protein [Tanacetum cinerariifolium]